MATVAKAGLYSKGSVPLNSLKKIGNFWLYFQQVNRDQNSCFMVQVNFYWFLNIKHTMLSAVKCS